ncbi:CDP-glycerol glycerophosphotransferase family protein [Virgibacillus sp. W0181]|uniref:CDP-glycerol glycerophosphotransferase family protein n=1 Tax=Virgibacillus sp. W0181 TaxID=3391581 RepID=UPI003F45FF66
MKWLKLIPTILIKYFLRTFYKLFCALFPIDPNKVTYASYRSERLEDNLYYIHQEIKKAKPSTHHVFLFRKLNNSLIGKITYTFHMVRSCYHLATSRYFIIDDFYFPIYVLRIRDGIEIIQLWHSSGALKKFGLSTVGKPYGPSEKYLQHVDIHGNYSKAYVSADSVVPNFAEAFGMPKDQIYPLGVPRTDYFFDTISHRKLLKEFYEAYPELVGKKLILYAPTFRGKSHNQNDAFECPLDLVHMRELLHEKYALIIHVHPYMKKGFIIPEGVDDFVYMSEGPYSIMELLVLTETLITDYSSTFIDFSLLRRRMIFYAYDLAEYKKARDFYFDYEAIVPGPVVSDTAELVEEIAAENFDPDQVQSFAKRFFDHRDGNASARIVDHIFEQEGVETSRNKQAASW